MYHYILNGLIHSKSRFIFSLLLLLFVFLMNANMYFLSTTSVIILLLFQMNLIEARGMEAPPRGGGADMEGVWPGTSGSVVSRETSHCPLWFSLTHPAPLGLDAMTQTWPRLRLCMHSPDCSAPGSIGECSPGPGPTTSYCPMVAGQSMVPRSIIPSRRASSGATRQEGPSVPSGGLDISPPSRTMETVGLASEGAQLIDSAATQLTALLVQCWSSCKIGSLQGKPRPL